MRIDIITLFPDAFDNAFSYSIVKRAKDKSIVDINIHNLRDWAKDSYNTVDDKPYGGGVGMILKVDIIDSAVSDIKNKNPEAKVILLSPKGDVFIQDKAKKLSENKGLIILCGHYEDFDQRIYENIADEVISIGEYVLTGGEIPAMVLVDSITRLLPGTLGKDESSKDESFSEPGYIEYPQYTRPDTYKGWDIPEVLKSGDHAKIEKWKKENSKIR